MNRNHACYMDCGSIINGYTEGIIEHPALFIDKSDGCLHGWGDMGVVEAKFNKFVGAYSSANMTEMANDMVLIELSEYKISREMACYVLRRAVEFTATGFIETLYQKLTDGSDPIEWLKSEMERIPIDLNEKEWSA